MNNVYFRIRMVKISIKYFLALCLVFLGGYNQLSAHTFGEGISHSSEEKLKNSGYDNSTLAQSDRVLVITSSLPKEESHDLEIFDSEEEELDRSSGKACDETSNYFTTFFCKQSHTSFVYEQKNRLSYFKRSTKYSAYSRSLHLLFCVFRI